MATKKKAKKKVKAAETTAKKAVDSGQLKAKAGDAVEIAGKAAVADSSGGKSKADSAMAVLPLSKVKVLKGFNPRANLGNLEELAKNVKRGGVINPITVRPIPDADGQYYVVAGHRRHAAAKEAGLDSIKAVIRYDLADEKDALAVAMAENSEDGRSNLNMIEQGRAFQSFADAGWSPAKIAAACGTNHQTVRRCLLLIESDNEVQKRVQDGTLSGTAAVEYAKLDADTRKKMKDRVEEGMSARQLREVAKEVAKADREATKAKSDNKRVNEKKGQDRDAALVTPRGSRAQREEIQFLSYLYGVGKADPEADALELAQLRGGLVYALWARGSLDLSYEPDAEGDALPEGLTKAEAKKHTKEIDRLIEAEAARYAEANPGEEDGEEGSEAGE